MLAVARTNARYAAQKRFERVLSSPEREILFAAAIL